MYNTNFEADLTDVAEKKSYLLGAIGALLGALIGAIPWAVAYYFGWFVGWLGFVIGFCAKKGYELLGGKKGYAKIWIICIATIIGVVIGNIAGDFFEIGKIISQGEIKGATYADIPLIYSILLRTDDEVLRQTIANIAFGLFFAALGVLSIIKETRAEINPQVMEDGVAASVGTNEYNAENDTEKFEL